MRQETEPTLGIGVGGGDALGADQVVVGGGDAPGADQVKGLDTVAQPSVHVQFQCPQTVAAGANMF